MSNPSKSKGTRFETAAAAYIQEATGWVTKRLAGRGTLDEGDLFIGGADAIVSCKNVRAWRLGEWVDDARAQAARAGTRRWSVWIKRVGHGDPAQSYVVMSADVYLELLREAASPK